MKIAIITDGNNKLGLGHVYQSITLASLLLQKTQGTAKIYFLTKSGEKVMDMLRKTGCPVEHFSDDEKILDALKVENPDRIIFDKLDVSPLLAKKIKEEVGSKLLIFTNLTDASNYADVTVFPRIGNNYKNIIKRDGDSEKTEYVGPKFWILRPEFYELKARKNTHNQVIKNIMLIFGGSDHANISSAVLNELLQIDSEFNILLVLGISFEHNDELNIVLNKNKYSKSKINIVRNMTNVGETMYNSDLVIASPGLSFFEALVVGTPVIAFHQNSGHVEEFSHIIPTMDIKDVGELPSIIKNKIFIFPGDPIIAGMEIGEGKDEIISEILKTS